MQRHDAPDHNNNELPKDMAELIEVVNALPKAHRGEVELALSRVVQSTRRRRRILNLVQEALSQLRLDMKYLMFDLEATRRERDQYRAALDQRDASGEE